jgi:HD-GYP domain-containing protein (c-di-GMP phosphodiesterase class II)/GGDEF domain-containing protein
MSRTRDVRTIVGGIAATIGAALLWRERERLREESAATHKREQLALAERDRLRGTLARREVDLAHRGRLIERLQRSRRAEREWNHELRVQLQRAQVSRGVLAEGADVRELVLEAAIKLVGAQKGLLLSRADADADGDLDLVCAHGFEQDPENSTIAQRFAREVIERDRILREDAPSGDGRAADREIENLVAIPLYLLDRFDGVIVCANREGGFEDLEDDVLLALGDHAGVALHAQRLQNELNRSHRAAVQMLAEILEARDPLVHREAEETALLARMLCRRLELEESDIEMIAAAALLRDIGQLVTPDHVLLKPGPLSPEERSIVELHPRTGFRVIGRLGALDDVAAAVLYHHERYDGLGYPAKLSGTAIPLAARVVAIADAYIAMTHERAHRPARSPEDALAELAAGAGTHFDPELTQIFLEQMRADAGPRLPRGPDGAGELPGRREYPPPSDPLTLLPGHRAFREAVDRAAAGDSSFAVAVIEIDGLPELNARDGYIAGDHAIVKAARGAQLAAERVGGRAYRDSGRRLAVLVATDHRSPQPDLAAELHIEFTLGPPARVGVAAREPGERGDDVVRRARRALPAAIVTRPQP